MIIECPACATRYNIPVPEGGRTVRCKKCATVWRAMPNSEVAPNAMDLDTANDETSTAMATSSQIQDHSNQEAIAADRPEAVIASEILAQDQNTHGLQNSYAADEEQQRDPLQAAAGPSPEEQGLSARVHWFENFRKKQDADRNNEASASLGASLNAETIPFPRPMPLQYDQSFEDSVQNQAEIRSLEEAREAVRDVFSNLNGSHDQSLPHSYTRPVLDEELPYLENETDAEKVNTRFYNQDKELTGQVALHRDRENEDVAANSEPENAGRAQDDRWASNYHNTSDYDDEYDQTTPGSVGAGTSDQAVTASDADHDRENAEDPDLDLRTAFTKISQTREFGRDEYNSSNAPAAEIEDAGYEETRLTNELESQLRQPQQNEADVWRANAPAFFKRPSLPLDKLEKDEAPDDDQKTDQNNTSYDARLYRELEQTREHADEPRRQGGSLTLAAAWGLFLCTVVGIGIGLIGLREDAIEQLPGLAPIYRALGVPVTMQPLLFESVQHHWDGSGPKPTLLITGNVVNRAKRKVRLPEFYVAVKHRNPELDREYPVAFKNPTKKIRAGMREEFEIELVGPDPSIRSVELELRSVK